MRDTEFNQECFGHFHDVILIEDGFVRNCDWCEGRGKVGMRSDPSCGDTVPCHECDGRGCKPLRDNELEDLAVAMMDEIWELKDRITELTKSSE